MIQSKNLIAAALAAAAVALSGGAIAQDRGDHGRDSRPDSRQDTRRDDHGNDRRDAPPPRAERRDMRQDVRRDVRHDVRVDERRDGMRGAGPDHSYYRGGRLPTYYRSNQYVVDDWRGHHLTSPPRGYHWVQTGSDYVLVAVATGIIASILLSN